MNIFSINKPAKVDHSTFDLSHEVKLTAKFGQLIPVLMQEVVPGDKFDINTQSMIRLAPMVAPVMHRINAYIHYFYVPNRILWDNWEKFITNEYEGGAPTVLLETEVETCDLADYLGIPPNIYKAANNVLVSSLPGMAYLKVFNDFYRDENLHAEIPLTTDVYNNNYQPRMRSWEKDYFTSALPWAQKGTAAAMNVDLTLKPAQMTGSGSFVEGAQILVDVNAPKNNLKTAGAADIVLDTIQSAQITVEELRRATRLQRWLERNARSGSRYVEHLLSHWGVRSSDARLQRAEYIGGGKTPIVISEVLNTAGGTLPQANMAGHGLSVGVTNQGSKYCEEHGFIVGIFSVMPEPVYSQGLNRKFKRFSNLDYYYPEFAQLGEQEVELGELYMTDDPVNNEATFGYQSRYAEYKYNPSTLHGLFRSDLEYWHLGRKFAAPPALNSTFISCYWANMERIFAVQNQQQLIVQMLHTIKARRPMPYFNDPTL